MKFEGGHDEPKTHQVPFDFKDSQENKSKNKEKET
jgi:hypothetical protein